MKLFPLILAVLMLIAVALPALRDGRSPRDGPETAAGDGAVTFDRFVEEETSRRFHSMDRNSQQQQQQHQQQQAQHDPIRIVVDHVDHSEQGGGGGQRRGESCFAIS